MPAALQPPPLLVDHMLVKLGRYLRCLGLDAARDPEFSTHDLIRRANAEQRVFLTRNRRLEQNYPRPDRWLGVQSDDPVEQVREVVAALDLDPERQLFTRCVRCNVALDEVPVESVAAQLPAVVRESYRHFWTCPACSTVFWKGSHVRNTCRKLGLADASEC